MTDGVRVEATDPNTGEKLGSWTTTEDGQHIPDAEPGGTDGQGHVHTEECSAPEFDIPEEIKAPLLEGFIKLIEHVKEENEKQTREIAEDVSVKLLRSACDGNKDQTTELTKLVFSDKEIAHETFKYVFATMASIVEMKYGDITDVDDRLAAVMADLKQYEAKKHGESDSE